MRIAFLILSAVALSLATFTFRPTQSDDLAEKSSWLLEKAIRYIRGTTEEVLDVVLLDNLSVDTSIEAIFKRLRLFLSREHVPKMESSHITAQTRKNRALVLDGSNFKNLQTSLHQINQSDQSSLTDKFHQYYFILSPNNLSAEYSSLFVPPLSCHMIFIQLYSNGFQIHRISAADQRVRTFSEDTSIERILDDRPDWYGFEARILTIATRPPFSVKYRGELIGIDIEVCKAIFSHANMSYRFLTITITLDYFKFRNTVEEQLGNGSIQMVIARIGFKCAVGELMYLRDIDGGCLMVPRSLQRNYIYHLLHPFEFDTWMVVVIVMLLDVILGLFFPIAFPHNLIMILLFGDTLSDHQQTRWTRFYCFACTVFLFLLSEAYLAKAIIYMTVTRYELNMKTLEEFFASDIPILIGPGAARVWPKSETCRKLLTRAIEDPNFYFHLDSDQYAYLVLCSHGSDLIEQSTVLNYMRHGREGKRMFYLVEQMIFKIMMQYSFQYQFLYYARFETALNWLYEAGLWDKWKSDAKKKVHHNVRYELRDEEDILFLEDLVGVLIVSVSGWAVSITAFLMELLWFYGLGNFGRIASSIREKVFKYCTGTMN